MLMPFPLSPKLLEMRFPETYKKALKDEGVSQEAAAEAAGVSQAYISRACNDRLPCTAGDLGKALKLLSHKAKLNCLRAYLDDVVPPDLQGNVRVTGRGAADLSSLGEKGREALSFLLAKAREVPDIDAEFQEIAFSLGWAP